MLVKYDGKVQKWIATVAVDGSPCVIVSQSMLRAMQLASWLISAPAPGELARHELRLIDGPTSQRSTEDTSEVYALAAIWRAQQKVQNKT